AARRAADKDCIARRIGGVHRDGADTTREYSAPKGIQLTGGTNRSIVVLADRGNRVRSWAGGRQIEDVEGRSELIGNGLTHACSGHGLQEGQCPIEQRS